MDNTQFIELEYKSKGLEKQLRKKQKGKYIVFRHGHIAITDVGKKDLFEFKKILSVWDKVSFKYRPVGYYYVEGMRELRIGRGFNRELLKEYFPDYQFIVDNDPIPCDTIDIELTTPPRDDYQKAGLTFMASKGQYKNNAKYTQFLIDMAVGKGKTYMGASITAYLKRRCIVIIPIAKLIPQWIESFTTFTTLKEDDIVVIQGSKMCEKTINGKYRDKKVFIVMANTLNSFHKSAGDVGLYDFYYATQAGIKIIDEVHRDMTMIQKIEALSNFRWNYYMSATPGRTDRKENWVFKMSYFNVPKFGSQFMTDDEKHLQVMIKKYLYLPTQKQINRIINKRVGMNTKTYETELRSSTDEQRQGFEQSFRLILQWVKHNLEKDYKVMVLAYTIDFLSYLAELAKDIFPGDVGIYYGGLKQHEKDEALKHKLIIATSSSLGTGADIKGLQFVINTTTYSNWIETKQISGRLREIKGVNQVYIELVNFGWFKTVKQFEKRKKYLVDISKTKKLIVVN